MGITIRQEQLRTGTFHSYDIGSYVSRMIKSIFVLCVFIAAVGSQCRKACPPGMRISGFCSCVLSCPIPAELCRAGQSQKFDKRGCKTCVNFLPRGRGAEVAEEVKTALEEKAQEEMVDEAKN